MKKSDLPFLERLYCFIFRKLNKNIVCTMNQKAENINKHRVVFYLNYPKAIHFGDTLWFEPLVRLFAKNYTNVYVYPSKAMSFYFKKLGFKIIEQESDIKKNDILITRTNLVYFLRNRQSIFIDFSYKTIKHKLIDNILTELEKALSLPKSNEISPKTSKINYLKGDQQKVFDKFNLLDDVEYVIFNNYIDSFDLQMKIEDLDLSREKLALFVNDFKLKNPKYKIIYTGSKIDLEKYALLPDFVDYDLRAKTSIEDLFILVSAPQIKYYIGYDTFLMHLFNLYSKDSYIKLRPGYDEIYNQQVKQYVAIPYSGTTHQINFI